MKKILFISLIFVCINSFSQKSSYISTGYTLNKNINDFALLEYHHQLSNNKLRFGIVSLTTKKSISKVRNQQLRNTYSKSFLNSLGLKLGYDISIFSDSSLQLLMSPTLVCGKYALQYDVEEGSSWDYGKDYTYVEPSISMLINKRLFSSIFLFVEGAIGVSIYHRIYHIPIPFSDPLLTAKSYNGRFSKTLSFGLNYKL